MYCRHCGVKLGEEERVCPICRQIQPDVEEKKGYFPATPRPRDREDFRGFLFAVTLFLFSLGVSALAVDLIRFSALTFSPYVWGGLTVFYAAFLLPRWWKRPNPVIFLPVFYALAAALLWYVDFRMEWGMYFTLLLPLFGGFALATVAAVTLIHYVRKGKLYIFGGLFLFFGVLSPVGEILYCVTVRHPVTVTFSLIPAILFILWGMGLIVIAIVRPFRRWFERRFFM